MSKLNKRQEYVLECALDYATNRGWHVLPVGRNKRPLIRDWTNKASTDEAVIARWWLDMPYANVGILTGPESGFWVVDTDNRPDFNGLVTLSEYYGDDFTFNSEKYLAGKTPTGGVHLLFQWDDDFPIKTTSNVLKGVDTRGVGGQIIVAPSSRNIEGEWLQYRWNNWDLPVAPMTPWTYDIVRLAGSRETGRLNIEEVMKGLTEGERDEQLNRFAWWLKGHGIAYELAVGFLMAAADRCTPPFDPYIAKEKVDRAYTSVEKEGSKLDGLKKAFGRAE